jgi:His/Glu/Gln/Arg/opine family amino acid ABC transporter permease subunit
LIAGGNARRMSVLDFLAILQGAGATVALSLSGIALGVPFGLALALVRWARVPILSPVVATYVSIMRATPAVTLALLIFFALPNAGIEMDPVPTAILTLTLNTAAFNCEIWRAALLDFPREQFDASVSFGMGSALRFRRIVLPQIVRICLPALVNEMSLLIKASPAVAVVGIVDATRAAVRVGAQTYRPLPPLLVALVIYAIIVAVFVLAQRRFERRRLVPAAALA